MFEEVLDIFSHVNLYCNDRNQVYIVINARRVASDICLRLQNRKNNSCDDQEGTEGSFCHIFLLEHKLAEKYGNKDA